MLFIMSAVLGISTFAVGMLPLLYAFSSSSSGLFTNQPVLIILK